MKRTLSFVGAALTVGVLLLPASPADAAFPGANGDLVFARFTHVRTTCGPSIPSRRR